MLIWSDPLFIDPLFSKGNSFAAPASLSNGKAVKKSKNGICHDTSSRSYERTKRFTVYDSIEACLNSGDAYLKSNGC